MFFKKRYFRAWRKLLFLINYTGQHHERRKVEGIEEVVQFSQGCVHALIDDLTCHKTINLRFKFRTSP